MKFSLFPFSRVLAGVVFCMALNAVGLQGADSGARPAVRQGDAPFVILKLDDLTWRSPDWENTVTFLQSKNVKFSIGIICEKGLKGDRKSFYSWVRELNATGLVEFWNHGYDHKEFTNEQGEKVQEFRGTSYEHQKEHFSESQRLAKEKLGITFRTFGPPFNKMDENTLRVLREDPDVKVLLYGKPEQASAVPDIMILERTQMNIEHPLFLPNPDQIKKDYEKLYKTTDCFVLQGHPNNWGKDDRFERFKELVNYLIDQGVTFTTPYEYYLYRQQNEKGI